MLDLLLMDPELYTLMALNVSLCMGLMFVLISIQRVSIHLNTPLSTVTDLQSSDYKRFDVNRSLLIQYFMKRRITKTIRNKVFSNDESDTFVSFYPIS